jgi:hypothetical protein
MRAGLPRREGGWHYDRSSASRDPGRRAGRGAARRAARAGASAPQAGRIGRRYPFGVGSSAFFCCPGGAGAGVGCAGGVVSSALLRRTWPGDVAGALGSVRRVWPGGAVQPRWAQPCWIAVGAGCGATAGCASWAGGAGCGAVRARVAGLTVAVRARREAGTGLTTFRREGAAARRRLAGLVAVAAVRDTRAGDELVACTRSVEAFSAARPTDGRDTPGSPKPSMPTASAASQRQARKTATAPPYRSRRARRPSEATKTGRSAVVTTLASIFLTMPDQAVIDASYSLICRTFTGTSATVPRLRACSRPSLTA